MRVGGDSHMLPPHGRARTLHAPAAAVRTHLRSAEMRFAPANGRTS